MLRTSALAFVSLLLLVGCSSTPDNIPRGCPQAAITRDLALWQENLPDANPRWRAGLTEIVSQCSYSKDEMAVQLALQVVATRNLQLPADQQAKDAKAEYFVVILGADDKVVSKQNFPLAWRWEDGQADAKLAEELRVRVPGEDLAALRNLRVWVGWQLPPAALQANRDLIVRGRQQNRLGGVSPAASSPLTPHPSASPSKPK